MNPLSPLNIAEGIVFREFQETLIIYNYRL